MTKRKINVDKLTDEQLVNAEKNIVDQIAFEVGQLLNRWEPEFKNFGQQLDVHVEVGEEHSIEKHIKSSENLSKFYNDSKLGSVAKELDKISYGMDEDLENAITNCNKLLNRYGMSCVMAFASKSISN